MKSRNLKQKKAREATWAWLGLTAYIIAYDAYALRHGKQTLSKGFSNGMATWRGRIALVSIWIILTKHLLLSKFHPELDVIGGIAHLVEKKLAKVEAAIGGN